jgi:hypothetical protein
MTPTTLHRTAALLCALLASTAGAQTGRGTVDVFVRDGALQVSASRVAPSDGTVTWVLRTPGFVFTGSGVEVEDPQGRFRCGIVDRERRTVRCSTSRSAGGGVPYALSVASAAGGAPPEPPSVNPLIDSN